MDLVAENEGVILEDDLDGTWGTLTTPADPQKPDLLKECSIGSSSASFFLTFSSYSTQALYSLSEGTATVMAMVSSPSSFLMICLLAKRS